MLYRFLILLILVFLGWLAWLHVDETQGVIGNLRERPEPVDVASRYGEPLRALGERLLAPLENPVADVGSEVQRIAQQATADFEAGQIGATQEEGVLRLKRVVLRLQAERNQYVEGLTHIQTRPIETLQRPANPERTREFLIREHARSWESRAAFFRTQMSQELREWSRR